MPLVKDGRVIADGWTPVADDAALPADQPAILSFARWKAEREALAKTAQNGTEWEDLLKGPAIQ